MRSVFNVLVACGWACGVAFSAEAQGVRVASGDVNHGSAVLWAQVEATGDVLFEVSADAGFGTILANAIVPVSDPTVPAKLTVTGLEPGVRYYYRATDAGSAVGVGTFATPAAMVSRVGFSMGVSGDWRGELAPYPGAINAVGRDLDLWVSLGDTVYADVPSPAVPRPQAMTLAEFRAKHNEVYADRFGLNVLGDIRSRVSLLAQIDDHEVTNDFSGGAPPASDPRFAGQFGAFINETHLFRTGLQAFEEYNPIAAERFGATGDPRTAGKINLFRARTYGLDAAVFSLDARSFRDVGLPAADPLDPASVGAYLAASFTPDRTMLGAAQLEALLRGLKAAEESGVLWKFVMVPEPIQNLGVLNASDRFEGYAFERATILRFIDEHDIRNVVFVAADIHGTLVNDVTYQLGPFQPQRRAGVFEVTTGSLAYDAPFGPTVAAIAFGLGIPGALPPAVYAGLPLAQREAYIRGLIDAQVTPLGYSPIGIDGVDVDARLLEGAYSATNTFGWTEFEVDGMTQALTVTTWGIEPYTEAQLLADPSAIGARVPRVVSRFVVNPRCVADFDGNRFVDALDLDGFLSCFEGMGCPSGSSADINADGFLDWFDFDRFLLAFELGC